MQQESEKPDDSENRVSRRAFLGEMRTGLGGIALACLLGEDRPTYAAEPPQPKGNTRADEVNPLAPRSPHFPVKAKRVIQIFCPGAASQIDLWEYKPELEKRHGQPMPGLTGVSS